MTIISQLYADKIIVRLYLCATEGMEPTIAVHKVKFFDPTETEL